MIGSMIELADCGSLQAAGPGATSHERRV